MQVKSGKDVSVQKYAEGVGVRKVISKTDGAKNFHMRIFEVEKGSQPPPPHCHPWEHEIYILEGQGVVIGDDGEKPFSTGDAVFIPANEKHQIKHYSTLRFI